MTHGDPTKPTPESTSQPTSASTNADSDTQVFPAQSSPVTDASATTNTAAGTHVANTTAGTTGSHPQGASSAQEAPAGVDNEDDEQRSPLLAPFRFMGRLLPFWAWVLIFGAILALIAAAGAVISMRSHDVGVGGATAPTQVSPSYAAPTTTGKWDNAPEIGGGDGSYNSYWTPEPQQTPASTTAPTTTTSSSKAPESSAPRPSQPPRGDTNTSPGSQPGGSGATNGNKAPDTNTGGNSGTGAGGGGGTTGGGRTDTGTGGNSGTGTGGGGTTGGNRNAG